MPIFSRMKKFALHHIYRCDKWKSNFNPKIWTDCFQTATSNANRSLFFVCIGILDWKIKGKKCKNVNMVRSMYGMANRMNPIFWIWKKERAGVVSIYTESEDILVFLGPTNFSHVHIQNINVDDCSIPL